MLGFNECLVCATCINASLLWRQRLQAFEPKAHRNVSLAYSRRPGSLSMVNWVLAFSTCSGLRVLVHALGAMHLSRSAKFLSICSSEPHQRGSSPGEAIKQTLREHHHAMRIRKLSCSRNRGGASQSRSARQGCIWLILPRRRAASKQPKPRGSVRCAAAVHARCNLADTARRRLQSGRLHAWLDERFSRVIILDLPLRARFVRGRCWRRHRTRPMRCTIWRS